ncbi:MAG TPA: hypothetical protein VD902_07205 [Symbiobacteriaceae bacterium]|nr:hypothetical protein [Symbiobacteriaceae bacterium]
MSRILLVGLGSGALFAMMDGLINANPMGVRAMAAYRPVARASVNIIAGVGIDLVYGVVLAALFVSIFHSLPGSTGLVKGLAFAAMVWFLRVVMATLSQWMIVNLSAGAVAYMLVSGLAELLILGVLYGAVLHP